MFTECKRSWHERCVPSAVIGWSRARRGEKSKTQPLSVEDAIDRSSAAVESRTCCLLDSDTNRISVCTRYGVLHEQPSWGVITLWPSYTTVSFKLKRSTNVSLIMIGRTREKFRNVEFSAVSTKHQRSR